MGQTLPSIYVYKFLITKLAISGIYTLSLDPSVKTYTDAMLQTKLVCRYIFTITFYCTYMCMNFVHTVAFDNCF